MADEVTLVAEPRQTTGSRTANRMRREGLIPAVVYGRGSSPRSLTLVRRELRAALTTDAGANALINLEVDGDNLLAIVRDMQRDPIRHAVTHVDFILVSRDEAVTVEVPVVLEGDAEEVHRADGTVEQQLFTLTVQAKPGDIPPAIHVDVSALTIGASIRVGDLALPAGATTEVDPEEIVVLAQVSQAAVEAEALDIEAAAVLEEAAEAEEGEGAEASTDGDVESGDEDAPSSDGDS
ncbi:MAG: 50S ribosomal protein L25 [Acidimicrobiia bacterium]|nr:50S ribosomal protein L25 [Acidimicrobiia bacterium]